MKDSEGKELTQAQAEFFKDSAVRDEAGNLLIVYHGTARADRVGYMFDPARATSGPMAFFTSDKAIADNYAKGKADTSIAYDSDYDKYETQFRVKIGGQNARDIEISKMWGYIPFKQRNEIKRLAGELRQDEDGKFELEPGNTQANGGFDWQLKEARGNVIAALFDQWLNSGTLFNEEARFLDVLEMTGINAAAAEIGIDKPYYKDPDYREEKTYEVYLNITKPFRTSDMKDADINALRKASKKVEYEQDDIPGDMWYKNDVAPDDWMTRLDEDIKNGTSYTFTSIPDWVSDTLRKRGYDGIVDSGGKYSGYEHQVYVPFS